MLMVRTSLISGQACKDYNYHIKQPYSFTGREHDSETGLYFYRARYYDAEAGRFISEDPAGLKDGVNPFIYVKNRPIMLVDPFGLAGLY
jgi:RHS repeat-associated protein